METRTLTFQCSICSDVSTEICVYCTKDACPNHHCSRCKRCSDCCECQMAVSDSDVAAGAANGAPPAADPVS